MPEDKNGAVAPPQANDKAYPLGIVSELGSDVASGERVVSEGEPPPMPVNAQLKWVGQPVPRIDGRALIEQSGGEVDAIGICGGEQR